MSPVAQTSFRAGRAMLASLAVIAIAIAVLWGASVLTTNRHNNRVATETVGGVANLGSASKLAARFERDGKVPIFFPDVSGNGVRGVYLIHQGERSAEGWTAFLAQVPGETSSCVWQWNRGSGRFDASCDAARHVDAIGSGLEHFPVDVVKGKLHLDLRSNADAPETPVTGN